jgi:DNA/RNA endonuclease G (NUC1)
MSQYHLVELEYESDYDELTAKVPDELTAEVPDELTAEVPDELTAETPDEDDSGVEEVDYMGKKSCLCMVALRRFEMDKEQYNWQYNRDTVLAFTTAEQEFGVMINKINTTICWADDIDCECKLVFDKAIGAYNRAMGVSGRASTGTTSSEV